MNMNEETSGKRLKYLLQKNGRTQKSFAEEIKVSEQTVSAYVSDNVKIENIAPDKLQRIARVLNTSVAFLTMRSNDDIPERFATWIDDPNDDEGERESRMNYRNAHIKGLMRSMNVRFGKTIIIKGKKYCTNYRDVFTDEFGEEVDREELLEEIRLNHEDAECLTDVFYHGQTKTLTEEQLNRWLGSLWNSFSSTLQVSFNICEPEEPVIADNDITRALKGLPPLE